MKKLNYLTPFDEFKYEDMVFESLGDAGQRAINRAFMNMPDIPLTNGEFLKPKDIVKVVSEAIDWIGTEFRTYYSFARDCNIIYLVNNRDCQTMAVDQYMNMYMDALFVYRDLKMNPQLIAAVIMHEIFHVVYNHIERGKNWLSANGKNMNDFKDTNLAADIEVNTTLINKGIIDRETLVNEIHGLFLAKHNGEKTNIPMEMILENEKLMNKLREMAFGPQDRNEGGGQQTTKTTEDWDDGYKKGWDKIAELLDKYGPEETIKKLQDEGVIDEKGQFQPVDEEVIMGMNFITIKSFEEFLNEEKTNVVGLGPGESATIGIGSNGVSGGKNREYKTFDEGFTSGVQKAVSMIWDAVHPQPSTPSGGDGGSQQNNQPIPQSNIKPEDLKKLNLPPKKQDGQGEGQQQNDGLPTNTNEDKPETQNKEQVGDMKNDQQDGDSQGDGEGQGQGQGQEGQGQQKGGQKGEGQGQNGEQSGDQQGQEGEGQGEGQGQNKKDSQSGQQGQEGRGQGEGKPGDDSKQKGSGKGSSGGESGSGDPNKLKDKLGAKENNGGKSSIDTSAGYVDKPKGKGGKDNGIGKTGSFMDDADSSFAKRVLEESGYSDEDIKNIINDTIEKNKRLNTPEGIKEKRKKLYSKLSPSDPVKKLLDDIEVSEAKFKNIWKKIMKQFLGQNCRRAGKDKRSKSFDWKNKRALSLGRLAPNFHKEQQEPQNINIYVDVSGSVNEELLTVIAKSLSIFCNTYEYTGINIIPWASKSNGVHEVQSVKKTSPEKVAKEILGYISQGISECGGGTDLLHAMLPELVAISNNKQRTKKDDKHIIITDGETFGEEGDVEKAIASQCGAIVNKNCFWMIYDASASVRNNWEKAISKGTLLFIDSKIVIGNG